MDSETNNSPVKLKSSNPDDLTAEIDFRFDSAEVRQLIDEEGAAMARVVIRQMELNARPIQPRATAEEFRARREAGASGIGGVGIELWEYLKKNPRPRPED